MSLSASLSPSISTAFGRIESSIARVPRPARRQEPHTENVNAGGHTGGGYSVGLASFGGSRGGATKDSSEIEP